MTLKIEVTITIVDASSSTIGSSGTRTADIGQAADGLPLISLGLIHHMAEAAYVMAGGTVVKEKEGS